MSLVLFEKQGSIGLLTLNHPEKLNAMSEDMAQAFSATLKTIAADKNLRVIILTGAGRAFSSGGHLAMLKSYSEKSKKEAANLLKKFYQNFLNLRNLAQPVIAAINGPAIGAGFCLALACDLRIASENAKMGANFAKIGLAPGMGGTYFLTHALGQLKASELLLTGKTFAASDAKELNLINRVCSSEDLLNTAFKLAKEIAENAPLAVRQIKKGLQLAQTASLTEIFDWDSKTQAETLKSKDFAEGILAVLEKRPPQFRGE